MVAIKLLALKCLHKALSQVAESILNNSFNWPNTFYIPIRLPLHGIWHNIWKLLLGLPIVNYYELLLSHQLRGAASSCLRFERHPRQHSATPTQI